MIKFLNIKIFKFLARFGVKCLNVGIFKPSVLLAAASWLAIFPQTADAGTIINRSFAIGLNQGLVGHWTFDPVRSPTRPVTELFSNAVNKRIASPDVMSRMTSNGVDGKDMVGG